MYPSGGQEHPNNSLEDMFFISNNLRWNACEIPKI